MASTAPRALVASLALAASALVTMPVVAHPVPSMVKYRWELDFEPGDLRVYADPVTGDAYFYFTFQVVNRSAGDRTWAPELVLYTDRGEILRAGDSVPSRIAERIREMLGNEFLELQSEMIGQVRQGPENARDGLVVWPVMDRTVNELSLFISGLSGETARVVNPISGETDILRKTMERRYIARGEMLARGSKPIEFVDARWVMR